LLSLSRNTVTRRVEELGCDIERQLQDKIKSLTCFSLALDESTDRTSEAQLAVVLRGLLVNLVLLKSFYTEALCAKSVALNNVMSVVVNCVNFIKSSSLRNRQFKELLEELGSHYENVPYYCHVRWLSRGALLRRFFQLRCEINNFMKKQGHEVPELTQKEWLCDLAFSTDLFHHLDTLNMSLQGKDKT
ncbi:hypothetical protein ANN_19672, partial [Periplaneta americana]